MDDKRLKKIIEECIIRNNGLNKEVIPLVVSCLPTEDWESIPGNTRLKRKMMRGYGANDERLMDDRNGWKWKAVRILMFKLDGGRCQKIGCDKKLSIKKFDLNHIDRSKDYFAFDPGNLQIMHHECHMGHEDSVHSNVDWQQAINYNEKESSSMFNFQTTVGEKSGRGILKDFFVGEKLEKLKSLGTNFVRAKQLEVYKKEYPELNIKEITKSVFSHFVEEVIGPRYTKKKKKKVTVVVKDNNASTIQQDANALLVDKIVEKKLSKLMDQANKKLLDMISNL